MTTTVYLKPDTKDSAVMRRIKELIVGLEGVEYVDIRDDMPALEIIFDEREVTVEDMQGIIGEELGIRSTIS